MQDLVVYLPLGFFPRLFTYFRAQFREPHCFALFLKIMNCKYIYEVVSRRPRPEESVERCVVQWDSCTSILFLKTDGTSFLLALLNVKCAKDRHHTASSSAFPRPYVAVLPHPQFIVCLSYMSQPMRVRWQKGFFPARVEINTSGVHKLWPSWAHTVLWKSSSPKGLHWHSNMQCLSVSGHAKPQDPGGKKVFPLFWL